MAGVAGFDSLAYPGDTALKWLLANTNLTWCGYYLAPAPSRPTSPWLGTYAKVTGFGWNVVPIYVGQQAQGPGSHVVTAAQGTIDGQDAAKLAQSEKIPAGTVIFLDIEQGPPIAQPALDYYKAWVEAVYKSDYYPGVYCSYKLAAQITAADARPVVWCFNINKFPNNKAVAAPYPDPDPSGCTFANASLWQLSQNVTIQIGGGKTMAVDLDSATTANPAGNAPAKQGASSSSGSPPTSTSASSGSSDSASSDSSDGSSTDSSDGASSDSSDDSSTDSSDASSSDSSDDSSSSDSSDDSSSSDSSDDSSSSDSSDDSSSSDSSDDSSSSDSSDDSSSSDSSDDSSSDSSDDSSSDSSADSSSDSSADSSSAPGDDSSSQPTDDSSTDSGAST
jgi:hypothetical protein